MPAVDGGGGGKGLLVGCSSLVSVFGGGLSLVGGGVLRRWTLLRAQVTRRGRPVVECCWWVVPRWRVPSLMGAP